ncbi:MAG: hypothetical protein PHF83_07210 [Candidatus Methanomethylophilus sp.]|nr:hypothetical protein [Methanomethylophilus sp.]
MVDSKEKSRKPAASTTEAKAPAARAGAQPSEHHEPRPNTHSTSSEAFHGRTSSDSRGPYHSSSPRSGTGGSSYRGNGGPSYHSDRQGSSGRTGGASSGGYRGRTGAPSNGSSYRGNGAPSNHGPSSGSRPAGGAQAGYHSGSSYRGSSTGRNSSSAQARSSYHSHEDVPAAPVDVDNAEVDKNGQRVSVEVPCRNIGDFSPSYKGTSAHAAQASVRRSPNRQSHRPSARNRYSPRVSTPRQAMLNAHRIMPFKYDMNEVLSQSSMDPTMASSFLASVIAKASRISIHEAKDYIKTFLEEGNLSRDEFDRINRLLDKYSRYR